MIKIAITKGRIQKQVTNLLENANYDVEPILNLGRELQIKTKDDLQIIFGKANDVITFLEHGIVDIGFVGKDTLDENDFDDYYELLDLTLLLILTFQIKIFKDVNELLQNIQE